MRELKIRAWHCESKTMYSWDDLINRIGLSESVFVETEQWKPMQYIGLKDEKDKGAYKSDVIKGIHKTTKEEIAGEVVWDDGAFQWGIQLDSWIMNFECLTSCYEFEIIGNVHQNPKLLEKQ